VLGHILNIIDEITDTIIPYVFPLEILLVFLTRIPIVFHKHLHVIAQLVLFILYFPSGIPLVYTDGLFSSVHTDGFND